MSIAAVSKFGLVDDRVTGRQAIAAAKGKTHLIIRFGGDRFVVMKSEDVRSKLRLWKLENVVLADVAGDLFDKVFARHLTATVQQDGTGPGDVEREMSLEEGAFLVVLLADQVVGLGVGKKDRASAIRPPTMTGRESSAAEESPASEGSLEKAASTGSGYTGTMTAGEDESPASPKTVELAKRYVNAVVEDHEPADPLQAGEVYTLAFDVDVERRADSAGVAEFKYIFKSEEQLVELTVQLASDDFAIHTDPQKLRVPRTGKSKNKARFEIEPKHKGEGVINAVFLKDGNFIQLMTIKLAVGVSPPGGTLTHETLGRTLDAAALVQPRDVTLTIQQEVGGFRLSVWGAVGATTLLPLTLPQLDQMIAEVRQDLLEIVYLEVGANRTRIYQAQIDIPPEVDEVALKRLAKAGFRLYQRIFYGPAADAQTNLVGDRLRAMARQGMLKIQIFSQHFQLPWGILYLAESYDEKHIDPKLFLGMSHIIEHIPLQQNMQVVEGAIRSDAGLAVSLNVNADIDQQMRAPLIANQEQYWAQRQAGNVKVVVRKTEDEVTQALADATTADQILYFYCHALSKSLVEKGGPDASMLVLTGNQQLTLEDLNLNASPRQLLAGNPLVFINACESAELSPAFYDGFVPYFMAKGARGVIGTECETPALFAAEWAKRFFDRFLAGQPLGRVFLDLRREFYAQHHNLMGLLYALYCDGDTYVVPGLA